MELPEVEDTRDWPDDEWDEWFEEKGEEHRLMMEEEMKVEAGWEALPFPELQPLACGVFLASRGITIGKCSCGSNGHAPKLFH